MILNKYICKKIEFIIYFFTCDKNIKNKMTENKMNENKMNENISNVGDFVEFLNEEVIDRRCIIMKDEFDIGAHINKGPKLSVTLESLTSRKPYQIFLTARSANFNIKEEEILKCAKIVERRNLRIYVHTPYCLNISNDDEYIVESLKKHLLVCSRMGFKGCVVHVGKSVKRTKEDALNNMRNTILSAITVATVDCPLLLETPAGQGTELLKIREEFTDFVLSIGDDRLCICVDTCHIFSLGYMPMDYINYIVNNENLLKYLKLFHYNDSETACNSHVDRHAYMFYGKIPMEQLVSVAFIGQNYNIPMVIEYSV
jgi:deoxyribonuclease-4